MTEMINRIKKGLKALLICAVIPIMLSACWDGLEEVSEKVGEGGPATEITIAGIDGVTAPFYNQTPVTEITETDQYTGTVSWSPAHGTFAATTVYTATITLTAKSGYTLIGVAEDFFAVAGASSVANSADSGVVTAVFPETGSAPPTAVSFLSAVQTGGTSGTTDSTGLTLSFSVDPATLAATNITVTGATRGALTGSGTTRSLAISGITVNNGATVSVAITNPTGYTISGSPRTAVVYRAPIAVSFLSAVQTGGTTGTADSTGLTLSFDVDPATLAAANITVTGATRGALTGSGTTRSLAISGITVNNGATVSVAITSPSGYSISGSPKTAAVYRALSVGMQYQGGVIAYILQFGDPGYSASVPHGLIAATADQSTGIAWITGGSTQTTINGNTFTELGTGQANTTAMKNQDGYDGGAAKVCDDYTNLDTGTGIYSDWYLPSGDELYKLYVNRVAIGGLADSYSRWSSSEMNDSYAEILDFSSGSQLGDVKGAPRRVRPVRSF